MSTVIPDELYTRLANVVKEPTLIFAAVERLVEIYAGQQLPSNLSTADMNSSLAKIGVTGKGNRRARGELCMCFLLMKLWNRREVLPSCRELCEKYGLPRHIVEKDMYFQRFCYYLSLVIELVSPAKHREFIIQDILTPLSGAVGIKYITGGGKEAPRTSIRIRAFEIASNVYRPRSINIVPAAAASSTGCGNTTEQFSTTTSNKRAHSIIHQDHDNNHTDEHRHDDNKRCRANSTEYSDSMLWVDAFFTQQSDDAVASTTDEQVCSSSHTNSQLASNPEYPSSSLPIIEQNSKS